MYIKAEYISYMSAYRLYTDYSYTIAYVTDLEEAEKEAKNIGYEGVILVEEQHVKHNSQKRKIKTYQKSSWNGNMSHYKRKHANL